MLARIACTLTALLALTACQSDESARNAVEATNQTAANGALEAPLSNASHHAEGRLAWDLPERWVEETPTSPMRMGQARIPGQDGDGSLAVFFFGEGGGGTLEDNLQRWTDQMSQGPGQEARRHGFEAAGLKVTWLEVSGTLKASGFGMGPQTDQPNSRLFGAVIEGAGGPWFFKATGPEAAMEPARQEFIELLESLRLEDKPAVDV